MKEKIDINFAQVKKLAKKLGLNDKIVGEFFDLEVKSYRNSSAKERYLIALMRFYKYLNEKGYIRK